MQSGFFMCAKVFCICAIYFRKWYTYLGYLGHPNFEPIIFCKVPGNSVFYKDKYFIQVNMKYMHKKCYF